MIRRLSSLSRFACEDYCHIGHRSPVNQRGALRIRLKFFPVVAHVKELFSHVLHAVPSHVANQKKTLFPSLVYTNKGAFEPVKSFDCFLKYSP